MLEKGIRGGICYSNNRYAKTINLYGWAMSQKLLVNKFGWIEDTSQFNEDFIKNYNKEIDEGYFLKLMLNILKNYMTFIMIYHYYLKE